MFSGMWIATYWRQIATSTTGLRTKKLFACVWRRIFEGGSLLVMIRNPDESINRQSVPLPLTISQSHVH